MDLAIAVEFRLESLGGRQRGSVSLLRVSATGLDGGQVRLGLLATGPQLVPRPLPFRRLLLVSIAAGGPF
jgi:hypothetical protein